MSGEEQGKRGAGAGVPAERAARVLVVDDEPAITAVIVRRLRRENIECEVAHSGEEAVRRLESESFDLVLTDVSMPGISGLELMRRIKSVDPLIQVILMTAHSDVTTAIRAYRGRADGFLLKPFDLEQLAESVRGRLDHRRRVLAGGAGPPGSGGGVVG
ncbi:MAG TPA: response regulator [Longimicrobiales bacterium]